MTINEVAKRAEVSVSAVSRYMNGGYVSEEKKERIRQTIEETGYVPSAHAQTLRTRKTRVIGVVLPKIDSESISRIVAGVSGELKKADYELLLANTGNDQETELRYLSIFDQNRVDGVIFIGTMMNQKHEKLLRRMRIPVVLLGQQEPYISCVYHDDYHAARELALLLGSGIHKRIAFFGVSEKDKAVGKARIQGFRDAMEELGIDFDESRRIYGGFSMESGYDRAKLLMEQAPDTDAIFCSTDTMAVGAIQYLKEIGKRIPEDVSIVGMGYTRMSQVISPKLTTVRYHYLTEGMEGARILLDRLDGPDRPNRSVMLGYELIDRESVLK